MPGESEAFCAEGGYSILPFPAHPNQHGGTAKILGLCRELWGGRDHRAGGPGVIGHRVGAMSERRLTLQRDYGSPGGGRVQGAYGPLQTGGGRIAKEIDRRKQPGSRMMVVVEGGTHSIWLVETVQEIVVGERWGWVFPREFRHSYCTCSAVIRGGHGAVRERHFFDLR